MKKITLLLWSLVAICSPLVAQLTVQLTAVPENTPLEDKIYLAGNFNGWQPGNQSFSFTAYEDGLYDLTFTPMVGILEFKVTRGNWDSVEGNEEGNFRPNRTYNYRGGLDTLRLEILTWEDLTGGQLQSTAAENVTILNEEFFMPQLNRNRRLWIYLPPDYATSGKRYPVLYMHDGQNLFDSKTSFSGEWQVDESLNKLFEEGDEGIIVVGIDNGGDHRLDEYSPWVVIYDGYTFGGEGAQYAKFLTETLKPYIDANYRTLSDRNTTGIMGSSMGGIISLYAALEYQEVFGKVGVFSPSFPIFQQAFEHARQKGKRKDMKIYLLAGERESEEMVPNLNRMYQTLLTAGFSMEEVFKITHSDGQHSEWYWEREFPDAYKWLFGNLSTATQSIPDTTAIKLLPNPADSILYVQSEQPLKKITVEFYSTDGRLLKTLRNVRTNSIPVADLSEGIYVIRLLEGNKLLHSEKVTIQ